MGWHRSLALLICLGYVIIAAFLLFSHPTGDALKLMLLVAFIVALGLAMLWFGDESGGEQVGISSLGISRYTPGCTVTLTGWAVFLLPVWIGLVLFWIE
jgi:hypothetical protein